MIVALAARPCRADVQALDKGQPVPADGVWMDERAAEQLAQDVSRARRTEAELEVARTLLAEKTKQVALLVSQVSTMQDAVANMEKQVATSARLDEVRALVDEITTKALQLAASNVDTQIKMNESNIRTLEQTNKALETANSEIARLRTRGFWDDLKGVLLGVTAFFAGKVF
jgi:DNA repair exonuclease SbcCD ATPase subunit